MSMAEKITLPWVDHMRFIESLRIREELDYMEMWELLKEYGDREEGRVSQSFKDKEAER